jgi:hypothetical protein
LDHSLDPRLWKKSQESACLIPSLYYSVPVPAPDVAYVGGKVWANVLERFGGRFPAGMRDYAKIQQSSEFAEFHAGPPDMTSRRLDSLEGCT